MINKTASAPPWTRLPQAVVGLRQRADSFHKVSKIRQKRNLKYPRWKIFFISPCIISFLLFHLIRIFTSFRSGSPTKGVVSVVVDSRNEGPTVFAVKEEHIVGRGTSITCGGVTVTSINVTHDEEQEFPQNGKKKLCRALEVGGFRLQCLPIEFGIKIERKKVFFFISKYEYLI